MRGFATVSSAILLSIAIATPAVADDAPDLSPLACAWDKLPAAEQARLSEEFKVELLDGSFKLHFGVADAANSANAAQQCNLNLTAAQVEHLSAGLARRAGEMKAKKGIADRGENPESIQIVLGKMHEGKREVIGDRLSCPGPHAMVKDWDQSMKGALRRANLRFQDGRAYSWVSLGVYAVMAEEGAVRRMAGKADGC
jgi:hypothetical protein